MTERLSILHERALAELTSEWQRFIELNKRCDAGFTAFDDLAQMGMAQMRVEPIIKDGRPYGSIHYFRLVQA